MMRGGKTNPAGVNEGGMGWDVDIYIFFKNTRYKKESKMIYDKIN